ncbi:JAB domain-containing protein [Sphingomonas sp.]|jgi:DNA repair protein RadC|uniref:JAB domain-containing protein n=1 Tax=Sphingomonas sp. TaxID=28214 RepID=UPI002DE6259C|nr:JAB domain-containing protein [Sphingomonas sp.]
MQDAGGRQGGIIDSLAAAKALLQPLFEGARTERLYVAHLGSDGALIRLRVRYAKMDKHIDFPLRTIVADALAYGSTSLILAHNHPSVDATPSRTDIDATRSLIQATRVLGVTVRDHLVFGGEAFSSFRQRGLL